MEQRTQRLIRSRDNRFDTFIPFPMPAFPPLSLLLLILSSVALSAAAQLLLKIGSAASKSSAAGDKIMAFATSPHILGGFVLYGLGAILWIFVLAKLPLSVAYPFVGLGFIFTMLLGGIVLGEDLSPLRVGGTLCVVIGCVLVATSAGELA